MYASQIRPAEKREAEISCWIQVERQIRYQFDSGSYRQSPSVMKAAQL